MSFYRYDEDGNWYRAKAVEEGDGAWKMYFIDYGNTDYVSVDDIRPISDELRRPPNQCFECILSGAQPAGGEWSEDAINRFEELVGDKSLHAKLEVVGDVQGDAETSYYAHLLDMGVAVVNTLVSEEFANIEASVTYSTVVPPSVTDDSAAPAKPDDESNCSGDDERDGDKENTVPSESVKVEDIACSGTSDADASHTTDVRLVCGIVKSDGESH